MASQVVARAAGRVVRVCGRAALRRCAPTGVRGLQATTRPSAWRSAQSSSLLVHTGTDVRSSVAIGHSCRTITTTSGDSDAVGGHVPDSYVVAEEPQPRRSKRSKRGGKRGKRRLRQHVNPLASAFQIPFELPPLDTVFEDPSKPLHLDIGCGRADFVMSMSRVQPEFNYLGVDVNPERVRRAVAAVQRQLRLADSDPTAEEPAVTDSDSESEAEAEDESHLPVVRSNVHVMHANISISLHSMFGPLPVGLLQRVSLLHPDPWFKKRHYKRRVINEQFLNDLASITLPGCEIYIKSDVAEVMDDIKHHFANAGSTYAAAEHLTPLPVPSRREQLVRKQDKPVYDAAFVRVSL